MKETIDVDGLFRGLHIIFGSLSDKERAILIMRNGLNDSGEYATLEETGRKFGVTRERIRQIEAKAKEKIRLIGHDVDNVNAQIFRAINNVSSLNHPKE